jgi:excisionase family DNA binding protein
MKVDEAARFLRVSKASIYRFIGEDPDLEYLKIGTRTLFRREDFVAYLAATVAVAEQDRGSTL